MRVVPSLDVLEDGQARRGLRREAVALEQFAFEGGEEALAHRVVVGVADRAHRGSNAHQLAPLPEGERRVLAALIGVMDDVGRSALGERHVQRVEDGSVRRCVAIAQPTTRRLHESSTTARYRKPAQVGM